MRTFLIASLLTLTVLSIPVPAHAQSDKKDAAKSDATVKYITSPTAAKLLEEKKDIIVLDIRTANEFSEGHIKGATNIDFNNKSFESNIAKLDKDKTYLVHCAAGGRSGKSLATFKKLGFKSIYHLDDGFNGWKSAGKPVEK